jgi:uncharacterized membrane protein YoaK (UPF0700 family)
LLHKLTTMKINWDGLGITASVACAIHCAVLPLVYTSLPLLGIDIIHNKGFEYIMILLALVIGIYALYHGYKKHHHSGLPVLLLCSGFIFLILKEVMPSHQTWMVIPALILIVSAHYYNYKLCQKAKHCHANDCNH